VNTKDEFGQTILMKSVDVMDANNKLEKVKLLVQKGADINAKSNNGITPLMRAASSYVEYGGSNLEMVNFLVQNGANINDKDEDGTTPLMRAIRFGSQFATHDGLDVIQFLVESGANVNDKNKSGETPLSLAKQRGNAEIVNLLIQHGAKE